MPVVLIWLLTLGGCALIPQERWEALQDPDGDGVYGSDDCNGSDNSIGRAQTYYVDADEDGCGGATAVTECPDAEGNPPLGLSENQADPDDTDGECVPINGPPSTCTTLGDSEALWVGPQGSPEKYTYHTIQAAIDAAGNEDTICVAPGTYVENLQIGSLDDTDDVVRRLYNDGSAEGDVVVQAAEALPVLQIWKADDGTVIDGFTFTGGTGLDLGAVIAERDQWWTDFSGWWGWYSSAGGTYESGVQLGACSSDAPYTAGGGLLIYASQVTLSQVSVTQNSACEGGGAWAYAGYIRWEGGDVKENEAGVGGGISARRDAELELVDVQIVANGTERELYQYTGGGGLALWDFSTLTATGVTLGAAPDWGPGDTVNHAALGGGLMVDQSDVDWSSGTITENEACFGGGVYATYANLTFTAAEISNNRATRGAEGSGGQGAGINLGDYTNAEFTEVAFKGNVADNLGGALNGPWYGSVSVTDSTFVENQGYNAAWYLTWSEAIITNTLFQANTSIGYGGALLLDNGEVLIENSLFLQNEGSGRGGAIAAGGTKLWITQSAFLDNRLERDDYGSYGGALYLATVEAHLDQLTVVNNRGEVGGGVYLLSMQALELTNSILAYNTLSSFDPAGENLACVYSGSEAYTDITTTHIYSEDPESSVTGCGFDPSRSGNSTQTPGFVAYDTYDLPDDWDLRLCLQGVDGCAEDSLLLGLASDGGDPGAYGRAGEEVHLPTP